MSAVSNSSRRKSSKSRISITKTNDNKDITHREFKQDTLIEKIESKEQQIYDLLSKIKTQDSKIELLNKEMEEKDLNIYNLEQNYKMQLEEYKNILGFKGDIQFLLNKKENTYEYEFAKMMKETQNDNIKKDIKIEQLKEEVKQIERENEQLNIFIEIKKNNETMIEILKSIENNKKIKKQNVQSKNNEELMIKKLIKKNNFLRKKISEIKNNINKSSNIKKALPNSFIPDTKKCEIDNDADMNDMQKKLEKLKEKEDNETKILLNKYLSIMEQNKKEIIKANDYFNNKINDVYYKEIKKYEKEIIEIFYLIRKVINIYYKSFNKTCSLLLRKEDCDKLLEKELSNLNITQFPLLFKILKNSDNINPKKNINKKFINEINIININSYNNNDDHPKIESLNNLDSKDNCYSIEELSSKKSSLFSKIEKKSDEQLNNLSKEKLASYALSFNDFINNYEKFINKYISYKFHKNCKKISEESKNKVIIIDQKINEINNKINEYNQKQNHMNIVMEYTSKVIQRLRNENLKLNQRIKVSISNDKKIKIPNLNMDNIYNSNEYFKKSITNRNSNKIIKTEPTIFSTDRGYKKDKNKIYKIKIK